MYSVLLILHNITRWLVLAAAVWALYRSYSGWLGRRSWVDADRTAGRAFAGIISLQFVLGLLLYFLPGGLVQASISNAGIGTVMQTSALRFFVVEHLVTMVLAVGLVHMGSAIARRAPDDVAKHRRAAIWYTIAVVLVLIGIPWGRPLLRI